MTRPNETELRHAIIAAARQLGPLGLSQGMSGNISARSGDAMLITPSATPYDSLQPDDLVSLLLDGDGASQGLRKPSTEWRMHRDILRARPELGAVVHAHPPHCTAISALRRDIPPCHYMIPIFGGSTVRCAPYAAFGTQALSDAVLTALENRHACLLANHGMVACAPTLARAMALAVELEVLARTYYLTLLAGGPVLLDAREVAESAAGFAGYGAP